jgi:hypothetical protein
MRNQPSTKNRVIDWIDYRLPVFTFLRHELHEYPTPRNLNYLFGSLVGITLVIMIVTGIVLAMHYTPTVDGAFNSVEHIMRDAITIGNVTGSNQIAGAPSCAPHSPTETIATMWSSPDIGCIKPLVSPPPSSPVRCAKALAGHSSKRHSKAAFCNRVVICSIPATCRFVGSPLPGTIKCHGRIRPSSNIACNEKRTAKRLMLFRSAKCSSWPFATVIAPQPNVRF